MTTLRIAAVQASYVLMDRDATIGKVAALTAAAAARGAQLIVFPEVFVPGTPIWIDTQPIWKGDEDWFALLADNAVVIPGPASEHLAAIAAEHQVWLVIGVQEREPHGSTTTAQCCTSRRWGSWPAGAPCSPARSASARKPWSPTSPCATSPSRAVTWIRSATTTARTSSGCRSTPLRGLRSSSPALSRQSAN